MSTAFERATDAVHRRLGDPVLATYYPADGAAIADVTVIERKPDTEGQLLSARFGLSPERQVAARYFAVRASQVPIARKDDELTHGEARYVVADRPVLDRVGGEWLLPLREIRA